jgi:hypothetical protein
VKSKPRLFQDQGNSGNVVPELPLAELVEWTFRNVRSSAAVRCKADISVDCRTIKVYEYTP